MADTKTCPQCGKTFETGGRGRPKQSQMFCSRRCFMLARPPLEHPGSHAPRPRKYKGTLHDEAWLREKYETEKLSSTEIGDLIGAPRATVKWALDKFGLRMRSSGESKRFIYDRRGRKVVTQREMLQAYGDQCACCGEVEPTFLSLDHINGGGRAERRELGGSRKMLQQLKARGWPKEDYRVLCMNCQFGTRFGRVCPHQKESS